MAKVRLGNEIFLSKMVDLVKGLRVGLITNHSGLNSELVSTVELFHRHPDVQLRALFGPEHGIRGEAQAGEKVTSYVDAETGLPVHSLYGETKKPTNEMLTGLDALIFDIQDVGVRYYTFISTMCYAMEKAAELGLKFIVLDRPNIIRGDILDGNVLDPNFSSFIGLYPLPIRYGLTIGELALFVNKEYKIGADLTVVKMEGWRRANWFDETGLPWVPSSLGIPTLETAVLYTGLCFIEGTNLSEGRGTTMPFHLFGAPWVNGSELARELNELKLAGLHFRPVYFKPTTSKHQGELCQGVQAHLLDREVFMGSLVGLEVLRVLKKLYPEDFQWFTFTKDGVTRHFIDLLWGTDEVRKQLDAGDCLNDTSDEFTSGFAERFVDEWEFQLADFAALSEKYWLYE